jgi:coenzyme PQQ precursor peptide PqqA
MRRELLRRLRLFGIFIGQSYRSIGMRWETPQAIEVRFGMEITMYIARR